MPWHSSSTQLSQPLSLPHVYIRGGWHTRNSALKMRLKVLTNKENATPDYSDDQADYDYSLSYTDNRGDIGGRNRMMSDEPLLGEWGSKFVTCFGAKKDS